MYGNGMAGIDGQRREHRVDLVEEPLTQRFVVLRDRRVIDDLDALGEERAPDVDVERAEVGDEFQDSRARSSDLFGCRSAIRRQRRGSGVHLLAQAGDPDLEELVEHPREDRHELDPLDQRIPRVAGLEQDARAVLQPRELAVDVRRPIDGLPGRPRSRSRGADVAFVNGGHLGRRHSCVGPPVLARLRWLRVGEDITRLLRHRPDGSQPSATYLRSPVVGST